MTATLPGLLLAAAFLAAAAAWVRWLPPRVPARTGALLTLAVAAALWAAGTWWPAGAGWQPVLELTAVALLAGHFGRWVGRHDQRVTPPPLPAVPSLRPAPAADAAPVVVESVVDSAVDFDVSAASLAAPLAAPALVEPPAAPAPRLPFERATLGRYRIEREIGRGSMGAVYLGHDTQSGRAVAIKTMALSREFEGDELAQARERFFREAEMSGRLRHPDIVAIFDASEDQGLAFIAMEYVNGHDLLRHTRADQLLPVPELLRTMARVASALAHAHAQGVVHRDVKPANVMVDPANGAVKVTDFGIARVADASRTRTGLVLGTPSFMSPEQMTGGRLDGRSDLYSLGVMLFQLLTGELPHRSDSMATLMHQIVNDTSPDVRTLRPGLPEALANVVGIAIEKRPELRYADGHQMAADLLVVAQQMEAAAKPPPPPPSAGSVTSAGPRTGGFEATVQFVRAEEPRHNPQH